MAFIVNKQKAPRVSLNNLHKQMEISKHIINDTLDAIEYEFTQKGLLSWLLERVVQVSSEERITKEQLSLWYAKYTRSKEYSPKELLNALCNFGIRVEPDKAETFAMTLRISYFNLVESKREGAPKPKNPKNPTRKEMLRMVDYENRRVDVLIDRYCRDMTKKIMHIEILESVIDQFLNGEITFKDFQEWADLWQKAKKADYDNAPAEYRKKLGLTDLESKQEEIDRRIFRETFIKLISLRSEYLKAS